MTNLENEIVRIIKNNFPQFEESEIKFHGQTIKIDGKEQFQYNDEMSIRENWKDITEGNFSEEEIMSEDIENYSSFVEELNNGEFLYRLD